MQFSNNIIIIGSSTGGPNILKTIFDNLPRLSAVIVIVQHIPAGFIESLRTLLQACTEMDIIIAKEGFIPQESQIIIAPTGHQLIFRKDKTIDLSVTSRLHFVCPAVDYTMLSIQEKMYKQVVGIVLTGMGHDGTKGIEYINSINGITIAQSPDTAPIATMPLSAINTGAVQFILTPQEIRARMLTYKK
jgi:two-component system, chemotaxis family, protein-glutamate methylesterase/glutaminase